MAENIAVYGAGAIGAHIGGRLHGAGYPVTVVEPWAPQRDALQRSGVTIHSETGEREDEHYTPKVIAPDALRDLGKSIDVLFMSVKSYDTMDALNTVLPYLAPDGLVVSMQNSINEEWIAPVIGNHRMVGGVILINAVLLEPGLVIGTQSVSRASSSNRDLPGVFVGEYLAPVGDNARRIAALLDSVWPALPVDDLMHERWSKLVNNTMMNTVSGISGLRSAALLADADARRLLIAIAAEALAVAEAEGNPLETLMGDYPAEEMYAGARGQSDVVDLGLAERSKLVSEGATTSMLQDVLRVRKTETDFFSGLIASKGKAHGILTPFCEAANEMAHWVETRAAEPSAANIAEVFRAVDD
jgi:2-dehydropantoate 2-reductase